MNAKALAQAVALDDAASKLKRAQNLCREALHTVRQTQAELNGVEVETIHTGGGHSDRNATRRVA